MTTNSHFKTESVPMMKLKIVSISLPNRALPERRLMNKTPEEMKK